MCPSVRTIIVRVMKMPIVMVMGICVMVRSAMVMVSRSCVSIMVPFNVRSVNMLLNMRGMVLGMPSRCVAVSV